VVGAAPAVFGPVRFAAMTERDAGDVEPVGPPYRHIRSFVRRRGHITQAQRRAFDAWFGSFGFPYASEPLDFTRVFGRAAPVVLEIGFGMGETTAAIAQAHPDVDFLGIEVFTAGVGALLKRIHDERLANIRIVHHDAVDVVRDMIPRDSLAGVHIFFPDPWQKKRHHKRRIVAQPFIGMLASRIAPRGYLHCATDWEDYARQMLDVLIAEPQLSNTLDGFAPARNPLVERPPTRFHARGERLGHGVRDLVFVRGKRPAG
jgi:tRNA (guanine-N7-)-methyltransferase